MNTLIKQIRTYIKMSQSEFARYLHVSFATVNRWENAHALPNPLAQSQIYDLCREKKVPVYDMTLEKIEKTGEALSLPDGRMLLYHGSKSGIMGKIMPKSRKQCDFGSGFYMGDASAQALTLICDYDQSKFYIVSVDTRELSCLEVKANLDWAMLVAYHRGKMDHIKNTAFCRKYREMAAHQDLIIGNIADDRMFYVLDNFFIGNVTDAALIHSLSALQLGRQYVAVSQKACDAIRIESEVHISYLERLFIKTAAEENRAKGISLANEICKNYRRKGLFFDEILDDAKRSEAAHE